MKTAKQQKHSVESGWLRALRTLTIDVPPYYASSVAYRCHETHRGCALQSRKSFVFSNGQRVRVHPLALAYALQSSVRERIGTEVTLSVSAASGLTGKSKYVHRMTDLVAVDRKLTAIIWAAVRAD